MLSSPTVLHHGKSCPSPVCTRCGCTCHALLHSLSLRNMWGTAFFFTGLTQTQKTNQRERRHAQDPAYYIYLNSEPSIICFRSKPFPFPMGNMAKFTTENLLKQFDLWAFKTCKEFTNPLSSDGRNWAKCSILCWKQFSGLFSCLEETD